MKHLKIFLALALALNIMYSSYSFAQGNGVGGGDKEELMLKQMLLDLRSYLGSDQGKADFPETVKYGIDHPKENLLDIILDTAVVIKTGPVYDGFQIERDCVSHFEDQSKRYIECNENKILDPTQIQNQPAIYALLFHEILIQCELEKPVSANIPSEYPISSRMKFHKETFDRMLPGNQAAPDPTSRPKNKIYYPITNWNKLGFAGTSVLEMDWAQATSKLIYDPYLDNVPQARTATIVDLPLNVCIVFSDNSSGTTSQYCEDKINGVPSGNFTLSKGYNPPYQLGDHFVLTKLIPVQSDLPLADWGGLFYHDYIVGSTHTPFVTLIDMVTSTVTYIDPCDPHRNTSAHFWYLTNPNIPSNMALPTVQWLIGEGFSTYTFRDRMDLDDLTRINDLSQFQCGPSPTPPPLTPDPSQWPNAVVAPNGTIWSDSFEYTPNCNSLGWGGTDTRPAICAEVPGGNFTGQITTDGILLQSSAADACKAIGGKLPTVEQFLTLPLEEKYWTSEKPGIRPTEFWTSSIDTADPRWAFSVKKYYDYGDPRNNSSGGPGEPRRVVGERIREIRNKLLKIRCVNR